MSVRKVFITHLKIGFFAYRVIPAKIVLVKTGSGNPGDKVQTEFPIASALNLIRGRE